jgi:hypothetical protein
LLLTTIAFGLALFFAITQYLLPNINSISRVCCSKYRSKIFATKHNGLESIDNYDNIDEFIPPVLPHEIPYKYHFDHDKNENIFKKIFNNFLNKNDDK